MLSLENKEMCELCKGKCCKGTPGIFRPSDFEDGTGKFDDNRFIDLIKTTPVVFMFIQTFSDSEIGYSQAIVPAPLALNSSFNERQSIVGRLDNRGTCANLTDEGCVLDFNSRPYQCKTLVPNLFSDEKCYIPEDALSTMDIAGEWLPFKDWLEKFVKA